MGNGTVNWGDAMVSYFVAVPIANSFNVPGPLLSTGATPGGAIAGAIANIQASPTGNNPYFIALCRDFPVTLDALGNFTCVPVTAFYGGLCQPGVAISGGTVQQDPTDLNPGSTLALVLTPPCRNLKVHEEHHVDASTAVQSLISWLNSTEPQTTVVRWMYVFQDRTGTFYAVAVYADSMDLLIEMVP